MRFNAYLKSYSKGENLIDKIALADLIINIISPLSFLLGVLMYELIGIIYAITFINFFIFIIYIYFLREYNFKLNFSLLEIIPIIKISSPLFLNGLLETLLLSVNIILITKYLDAESVGIFAFATAFMFAKKIPFAAGLNNILSRRILVDFGKYGFSRIDIHQSYIIKNQILYMFFHSIFLGIILLLLSLMVPLFLNDYNNSINIMGTVIFGVIVYSISSISKFFLVAIKDFSSITYITLIGILINAIFTISFLTNGYGLNEIALSMSITFIIMTIFYSIRVNKIIKIDPYSSFIFISKIMLSTLCIILSLLFIINYNKADLLSLQLDNITFLYTINIIGQTLLKISIFIIISIITLTFFFPKQKILNNIAKIILRFN